MTPNLNEGDRRKELLLRRFLYPAFWSVAFQIVSLVLFLAITQVNVFSPSVWLTSTFAIFTQPGTWMYLSFFSIFVFSQAIVSGRDYQYETPYHKTRLLRALSLISLQNFFMSSLFVITGGLTVWIYLSLCGGSYASLYKKCDDGEWCFIEEHFFLLLSGLWSGLYYFIKHYLFRGKHFLFPIIQQGKYFHIKTKLGSLLWENVEGALWPVVYFVLLYYYRGTVLRDWLITTTDSRLEKQLNLYSLLGSFGVLSYTWLFTVFNHYMNSCMHLFFEAILTEHYRFSIGPVGFSLQEAISEKTFPIVQHLGCYDLYVLSTQDYERRSQIFTLSQPGGHPHNWNGLLNEILKLMTNYTNELNLAVAAFNVEPVPVKNIQKTEDPPVHFHYSIRNMSLARPEPVDVVSVSNIDVINDMKSNIKTFVSERTNSLVNSVCKKPAVAYLFGEEPELRLGHILEKGQPIIWTTLGVSFLCTASFTEDKYGIIQRDLEVIINHILSLKQSLDKATKVSLNRKYSYSQKYGMKVALRSAVKRSLYNIVNVFGGYLEEMSLSKDVKHQMQTFVAYKEG